jgi:hypothetical protein
VAAPRAYAIVADGTSAVERIRTLLSLHGIRTERVNSPRAVAAEAVVPGAIVRSERAAQGHEELRLVNSRRERRTLSLPTGSLIVPMDQPLSRLAFHLLEPTSDDGVVTWNFLDEWLTEGKDVPVFRVIQ